MLATEVVVVMVLGKSGWKWKPEILFRVLVEMVWETSKYIERSRIMRKPSLIWSKPGVSDGSWCCHDVRKSGWKWKSWNFVWSNGGDGLRNKQVSWLERMAGYKIIVGEMVVMGEIAGTSYLSRIMLAYLCMSQHIMFFHAWCWRLKGDSFPHYLCISFFWYTPRDCYREHI